MFSTLWTSVKTWLSNAWSRLLTWTKNSATVLWLRIQGFAGIFLALASTIDWTGLAKLDWANKSTTYIGLAMIANAIITEIAHTQETTPTNA